MSKHTGLVSIYGPFLKKDRKEYTVYIVIKLQLICIHSYVDPLAVFLPKDHLFVLITYLSIRTSQVKHTTTEPKVKP